MILLLWDDRSEESGVALNEKKLKFMGWTWGDGIKKSLVILVSKKILEKITYEAVKYGIVLRYGRTRKDLGGKYRGTFSEARDILETKI